MQRSTMSWVGCILVSVWGIFSSGCMTVPTIAQPGELTSPKPILGNSGKYMCPFTQDNVMAEWTDNAINAKMGTTVGKHVGAYVGQKALEQVPFIGGMLGSAVGEEIGRNIAIESSGGWDTIKKSSDISFNSFEDMSLYLYVNYSLHEHYSDGLAAAFEIYPGLQKAYHGTLVQATRNLKNRGY